MKNWQRIAVVVLLQSVGLSECARGDEKDTEIEQIKAHFAGKSQVYYRVGGILYGTHHLIDLECQPSGRYTMSADTAKPTILGNLQRGGWQDAGRWDIVRMGRQCGVRLQPDNRAAEFYPVEALANGEVRLLADGLPAGTERHWLIQGWKYQIGVATGKPPSITLDPQ